MDDQHLRRLPEHVRPRMPVTDDVYRTFVTNNFPARCRKLAYAYESDEPWGAEFREKLDKPKADGGFVSLEVTVKDAELERLWWEHSPAYQPCRAVAKPGEFLA
ncbi:Hypp3473 [Branchiostoma lanceolatum]|uniref:Hypp3473 protein n=1 Tax=Branchiostoma lanceolatum TaxID=7740 RepID=A0A8K0A0D5_BRALA|nr:Hypp3473 [Branchiostoma lanceolatum]